MRFGAFCDLSKAANGGNRHVLDLIMKAGFDFVEANLTSLACSSDEEFDNTKQMILENDICVPVCLGMFPAEIRLTGESVDFDKIEAYVDRAFYRAKEIGTEKIVLGSDKSRQLPDGYDLETAYQEMAALIRQSIVPACEKYGMTVLIEPLRRPCNFINTLTDGMRIVRTVSHSRIRLLADTLHMMSSGEDPAGISMYLKDILHVHICDWNRMLPEFGFSSELSLLLRELQRSGYDGTISFEVGGPENDFQYQRSLLLLKQKLGK